MKRKLLSMLLMVSMILTMIPIATSTVIAAESVQDRRCGDVTGEGSVAVNDAVQILMVLAKNPTAIPSTSVTARRASLINEASVQRPNKAYWNDAKVLAAAPTVADAVQVLMRLAGNPTSKVFECENKPGKRCDWCITPTGPDPNPTGTTTLGDVSTEPEESDETGESTEPPVSDETGESTEPPVSDETNESTEPDPGNTTTDPGTEPNPGNTTTDPGTEPNPGNTTTAAPQTTTVAPDTTTAAPQTTTTVTTTTAEPKPAGKCKVNGCDKDSTKEVPNPKTGILFEVCDEPLCPNGAVGCDYHADKCECCTVCKQLPCVCPKCPGCQMKDWETGYGDKTHEQCQNNHWRCATPAQCTPCALPGATGADAICCTIPICPLSSGGITGCGQHSSPASAHAVCTVVAGCTNRICVTHTHNTGNCPNPDCMSPDGFGGATCTCCPKYMYPTDGYHTLYEADKCDVCGKCKIHLCECDAAPQRPEYYVPKVPGKPAGQPNAPEISACAYPACTNTNVEICPNCGYCRQCEWTYFGVIYCSSCQWGNDCLASRDENGKSRNLDWCGECNKCRGCCEHGDSAKIIAPSVPTIPGRLCVFCQDPVVCSDCVEPICPNCNFIRYGIVTCPTCKKCGDCVAASKPANAPAPDVKTGKICSCQ